MNPRQIALLTRRLIAACGGLEEASNACLASGRHYSVQQLSRCQTPDSGTCLAVDVMGILEAYCGKPVVSQAFAAAQPAEPVAADLLTEACEAGEAAIGLQKVVRLAAADGHLSPRERDQVRTAALEARDQVTDVLTRLDAPETAA